ncbi:alpha/beta fold hydrolase [Hyphococcus sp.]|jgi:pimeloyl-ACP methyl ester carboxylesterase|uniref:alpha/beta fold hydrolase n=1 Tax=Hyphococcus sp. TaxID=2038636 RepID=UPI003D10226F
MLKSSFVAIVLCLFFSAHAKGAGADHVSLIETNGVQYNVKTYGSETNEAVVLMHGWMGTAHTWRKLAPKLADNWFVIVPDMRGYGKSDKPEGGYDAVNMAGDVKGILNHFGKSRAHIVGHDMGALVALAFAGTYPGETISLTYLDEPLVGYNLDQFTVYREETYGGYWHFGFNTAPGLPELLISGKEQAFVDWIVPLMHAPNPEAVTAADRKVYADSLRAENGVSGSVGWYRATFETARQLRAIGEKGLNVPVMAWGGQYGVPVTHEQMSFITDDAQGGIIPDAGHLLPEEKPEFLAKEMRAFFLASQSQ